MKRLDNILYVLTSLVIIAACGVYIAGQLNVKPTISFNAGSIEEGQAYNATGTAPFGGVIIDRVVKTGRGSLGSLVVTKAGDAAFDIYDATSTAMLETEAPFSSSTQLLASIPASLAAGTYVFDVNYNYGILLEVSAGNTGTSTITYR